MRRFVFLSLALSACTSLEAPQRLESVEYQWAAAPRDDGWRVAKSGEALAKGVGDALWFRVNVPAAGAVTDPALQSSALFADDLWACGHHFQRVGMLPIIPVPCSPTQVTLRSDASGRLTVPTFLFGSEQNLFTRLLRRDLSTFVVGATMALVGLLFLAAGLRAGAERAYRGLGLFIAALGVLTLLGTQLRHALPASGSTIYYVHEVMTSLYPFGFVDFLLGTFGDGPRRVLRRGIALFAVYVALAWGLHFAGVLHINDGRSPTALFIVVFLLQGMVLAARKRKTDPTARVFLVGLAALFLVSIPDIVDGFAGTHLLPFQTVPYAVLSFGVAMVVMIEQQHRRAREAAQQSATELAAKLAALEERNREINSLNTELRHQIAERSREMADALQGGKAEVRTARELAAGDVVDGRYRVTRVLGRGAMGAVHAVERLSDGRVFALKMMTGSVDTHLAARFAREAEIAARVADEHLVKVVDVGGAGSGELYLVMEYVDGRPLEDHRARFGDVPWALGLLSQIAAGVRALHAAGVVHRDLKPANVLLTMTAEGRVLAKISDFGISRRGSAAGEGGRAAPDPMDHGPTKRRADALDVMTQLAPIHGVSVGAMAQPDAVDLGSTQLRAAAPAPIDATTQPDAVDLGSTQLRAAGPTPLDAMTQPDAADVGSTHLRPSTTEPELRMAAPGLTAVGSLLGTPAYMAPELAGGAQHASPASDLFALGLIAYELLSGRSAFPEPPVFSVLAGRQLAHLAAFPPSVPADVAPLVIRCLSERPDARPSAVEFADSIRAHRERSE